MVDTVLKPKVPLCVSTQRGVCSVPSVEHACARCQDQTGALHMFCDTNESESCLVKAPAKHASESVLVVGELLCTGVQANTERHTRKETREKKKQLISLFLSCVFFVSGCCC